MNVITNVITSLNKKCGSIVVTSFFSLNLFVRDLLSLQTISLVFTLDLSCSE